MAITKRLLSPFAEVRDEEGITALLMFAYSFCAMAGYNVVKPATRSQFINSLGADNLPYVQLVAGLIMGFVIQGYTSAMRLLPRRWVFATTQVVMVGLLLMFWVLFQTGQEWVSVAFYLWGVLAGSLLISQFWTLANDVYDARQAKRLFGFIGGGASLGGIVGAGIAAQFARAIGTNNLLIVAAVILGLCFAVVWAIAVREKPPDSGGVPGAEEESIGLKEAIKLLVESKHFQVIAIVISMAAIGAGIIEQQLNMSVEDAIPGKDARTAFLGNVIFYSSIAGFLIQMTLTSKIHRLLGIGFALLLLPFTLGATGVLMLMIPALWTSTTARVLDTALRYTVDKTTREILFMPLPTSMKYKAKPFADVAVDRFAKGVGAAVALIIAIKIFDLHWWQLSYLSLTVTAIWIFMALRARREYLRSFRRGLERREMDTTDLRVTAADLRTIETLVEELAHPDEARVLYAIDVLESLDKRNLVTPLLLYHESPAVRARALAALATARPDVASRWLPSVQRMLADPHGEVRAAAVGALAAIRGEDAANLARPLLADRDPRIACTASVVLASSSREKDVEDAEAALVRITSDTRPEAAAARRDVAAALARLPNPRLRPVLIPLLYDSDPEVAEEALRAAKALGSSDFLFVPTLVSLLRRRRFKSAARDVLVSYGEPVLDVLSHFLHDADEDIWVRRHLPATIARFETQKAVDILTGALGQSDGFLRYKAVAGLERLRRANADLTFPREPLEALALNEGRRYLSYLTLGHNLTQAGVPKDSLLVAALKEKAARASDRVYRLLALIYPWKDIAASRWALQRGDARARSSASEYLDNILTGNLRKRLMLVVEDMPFEEKVRKAHVQLRSRQRDVEETLLELINDDDQVLSAAAIDLVRELKVESLEDDVEHVLAHRDAKDWYVFEAASWTLAARRVGEAKRRDLWLEPLPAVEIAARLRRLPLFASLGVDELFRIAGTGRQTRHDPGHVLLQDGATPETVHVLLDGTVAKRGQGSPARDVQAPATLGFEEALEGRPMAETVRCTTTCVTLSAPADAVQALLADNTDLVEGLFRTLLEAAPADGADRTVIKGAELKDLQTLATGGLSAVEKVLVLQAVPVFTRVSAEELVQVASIARETRLESGAPIAAAGDGASIIAVIAGELAVDPPSHDPRDPGPRTQALTAGPGDLVGVYETMAGLPYGRAIHVTRAGCALTIERGDLFDLAGQRPALLQQMFGALFRSRAAEPVAG
jgi:AAA family ATP:ADP antiporter